MAGAPAGGRLRVTTGQETSRRGTPSSGGRLAVLGVEVPLGRPEADLGSAVRSHRPSIQLVT